MYFLIEYDREAKKLIRCEPYKDRKQSWADRLQREKELFEKGQKYVEVVIFESDSEDTLRQTHSRYFQDFQGVIRRFNERKHFLEQDIESIKTRLKFKLI